MSSMIHHFKAAFLAFDFRAVFNLCVHRQESFELVVERTGSFFKASTAGVKRSQIKEVLGAVYDAIFDGSLPQEWIPQDPAEILQSMPQHRWIMDDVTISPPGVTSTPIAAWPIPPATAPALDQTSMSRQDCTLHL